MSYIFLRGFLFEKRSWGALYIRKISLSLTRDLQEFFPIIVEIIRFTITAWKMRKTHCALKKIYYATSGNAGQLFFHSVDSDESKISLTFPSSPWRDVHSYYPRYVMPEKLDLVFCKEYSFKLIHLKWNWVYLFGGFMFFNVEYWF